MKKHELNDGFDWKERNGPFRLICDEQAEQYNRDGFLVFEDVFDEGTIDPLLSELDPIEEATAEYQRKHLSGKATISRADEIRFAAHLGELAP